MLPSSRVAIRAVHAPHSVKGQSRTFWFNRQRTRLFDIEGLEAPRDFPRLANEAIQAARQELDGVAQKPALQLVTALDNASNGLCRIADAAELCRNVHPDEKFVACANDAVQNIANYMGEVNLDSSMYDGMKLAEAQEDFDSLPLEARTVLRHMRVSMEHEGIHLSDEHKAECLQLLEMEQQLSFDIVQRCEQVRRSAGAGGEGIWIPKTGAQEVLGTHTSQFPERDGKVLVPAGGPCADQLLREASCQQTRRVLHDAQQVEDEQGEEAMAQLLHVRQRLACLRGYKTWNEYAQREALLSSPHCVSSFLDSAWERLRPGVVEDLCSLAEEKQRRGLGEPMLEASDIPLLINRCRQQQEHDSRISEYLTYSSLMAGVDLILSDLLGLRFVVEEPGPGEVWHPSVQKYTLREGDRILGVLYLDPFARHGKVIQSAQFTLQGSKTLAGDVQQVPVTTLVFALPVGTVGMPISYAITFMHEIGHAVHSLLSSTTFQHLSGTRGTVDFVEFPSHLFEHFVLDPDCLALYARHAKTGDPMPQELQAWCAGRQRFAHFEAVQQLLYAAIDQAFYEFLPPSVNNSSAAGEKSEKEAVRQHLEGVLAKFDNELEGPFRGSFTGLLGLSKPSKFDHLVHYGGSYYCYLFNRALSAHVWRHGFRGNPLAADSGKRLREFLRGGSVVQSLGAIESLCPGGGSLSADNTPLDAFIAQLRSEEFISETGGRASVGGA